MLYHLLEPVLTPGRCERKLNLGAEESLACKRQPLSSRNDTQKLLIMSPGGKGCIPWGFVALESPDCKPLGRILCQVLKQLQASRHLQSCMGAVSMADGCRPADRLAAAGQGCTNWCWQQKDHFEQPVAAAYFRKEVHGELLE